MPRWGDGGAVALDFAVTCGLRATELYHSATDPSHSLVEYENFKREYLSTAQQCEQQHLQFTPMVVEAHGGSWGPAAKETFKAIARAFADQSGTPVCVASAELAQRISITLERENARAILRRLVVAEESRCMINSAAWDDDEDIEDPSGDALMSFQ